MKLNFKKFSAWFVLFYFIFNIEGNAKNPPESFADLAEKLMPSVVNISTTQTIKTQSSPFPFQFPPGSPFGEMFKEFEKPTERKATSLGSGFVIEKNGTVITNNHVIANAEDIIVRVNNKDSNIAFIPTDFPDPVVPATSRCGIFAKSTITGVPKISLPKAKGSLKFSFVFKLLLKSSLR